MTAIPRSPRISWTPFPLVVATAVGLGAGAVTAALHDTLPGGWAALANSVSAWTLLTVSVAAAVPRARGTAVFCGLLALVAEVVGYYEYVTGVLHRPVLPAEIVLWMLAALWVGPVAGRASFALRWGSATGRAVVVVGLVAAAVLYALYRQPILS